jgi:hypothetical protein
MHEVRLPPPSAHNQLRAHADAVMYRQILMAADCADCGKQKRCEQHEADGRLIGYYRKHCKTLVATMTAAREAHIAQWRQMTL